MINWKKRKENMKPKKRKKDKKKKKKKHTKHEKMIKHREEKKKCLPCFCSVSCAQPSFKLDPDNGLCARKDERTCMRIITVDVTSSVQAENKCSAVAMWMVRHKHFSWRGWPQLPPPPGVLALCQLRTHAVKEVSDQHFENSSYSPFEIHICCGTPHQKACQTACQAARLKPDIRIFVRTTNNLDWKQLQVKWKTNLQIMHVQPTYIVLHMLKLCTLCELWQKLFHDLKTKNSRAFNRATSRRLLTIIDPSNFSCVLLHYEASKLHSTNRRFPSSPNSFVSGIMLNLNTWLPFWPDPLT